MPDMFVMVRIKIGKNNVFMGKGVKELLDAIELYKSILKASGKTGISYPKAIRMLKQFEQELGFPAVISQKGGSDHGGTQLTEKGREVLQCYREIESETEQFVQKLVEDRFNF